MRSRRRRRGGCWWRRIIIVIVPGLVLLDTATAIGGGGIAPAIVAGRRNGTAIAGAATGRDELDVSRVVLPLRPWTSDHDCGRELS